MEENKGNSSSFTMDYEKKEIVVTIYTKDAQPETRFTERDIKSMLNWFDLARLMESESAKEKKSRPINLNGRGIR